MSDIKELYHRLRALPWPTLAGKIGDFALYESLLAGYVDRVLHGDPVDLLGVPIPDDETIAQVRTLRQKAVRSGEETDFLEYFNLLEEIRLSIVRKVQNENPTT